MKRKVKNNVKSDNHHHSYGINVVLNSNDEKSGNETVPFCEHGPCLLFERQKQNSIESEKFYACSVCRGRKLCPFYMLVENANKTKPKSFTGSKKTSHKILYSRLKQIRSLPIDRRYFCKTCQTLTLPDEISDHNDHQLERGITNVQLKNPSKLLSTLENKDKEAQYWFSKSTLQFFAETILRLKFDAVLCVGAPRLHELLCSAKYKKNVKSFLLDYDDRYAQFYSQRFFAHFNMFANYFYEKSAEKRLRMFFSACSRVLIVVDPPFGGLASPIARTIQSLIEVHKNSYTGTSDDVRSNCMWIFPYFFQSKLKECYPQMNMTDYQVEYENHPLFQHKKQNSPVRIFTDISQNLIKMPVDKYRLCEKCDRYVAKTNKHCILCKICPSKDGKTYVHCKICSNCVKPNYKHCEKCNCCHLPNECRGPRKGENDVSKLADIEIDKEPMKKKRKITKI